MEVLRSILSDLQQRGPTSDFFQEAVEALAGQFIVSADAPFEQLSILPLSMLLTLGLVLLLIFLLRKRRERERKGTASLLCKQLQ